MTMRGAGDDYTMLTRVPRSRWETCLGKVRNMPDSSRWCSNRRQVELQAPCNRHSKGSMLRAWGRQSIWGRAQCNPAAVPPHSRTFLKNEAQMLWRLKTISITLSPASAGSTLRIRSR
jgi:hypothetical protein